MVPNDNVRESHVLSKEMPVAVVGAGPIGLLAGLAAARSGLATVVLGPRAYADSSNSDPRTTAVFGGGVRMLERLGVWEPLQACAAPIRAIRLIDATGGLLRAPEVVFDAGELGREAFGYNVVNAALVAALEELCGRSDHLTRVPASVDAIAADDAAVTLHLAGNSKFSARLVIGADGRHSKTREAAGIGARRWSYDQMALALNLRHSRSHEATSNELHGPGGPFTTVPLGQGSSSLVWVERTDVARELLKLSLDELKVEITRRLKGLLGRIEQVTTPAAFPLSGLVAERLAQRRIALAGEAAHAVPPIGAQGLNLGLRDVAHLADLAAEAARRGDDPGGREVLEAYEAARRADVESRTVAVDLLNRTLLSGLLPLSALRGLGLHALAASPWLRRKVMAEGVEPALSQPSLMRDAAST